MRQKSGTSKEAADKLVRGIKRKTRKHYSAEEKIRIVLAGLRGEDSIAALCRREGIEGLVLSSIEGRLSDKTWLSDQARRAEGGDDSIPDILQAAEAWVTEFASGDSDTKSQSLVGLIDRIDAHKDRLRIRISLHALLGLDQPCVPIPVTCEVPFQKRQNGRANPIIIKPEDAPQPDPDLIALVADARRWARELVDGKTPSIQQITEREGLRNGYASRILPLAWLAPDISTAIPEGRQPADISAKSLRDLPDMPLDWEKQRESLGFPHL